MSLKVTIPRDRWMRGEVGKFRSANTGKMCVLGHCLVAAGVPEEVLVGRSGLDWFPEEWIGLVPTWMFRRTARCVITESDLAEEMVDVNDSVEMLLEARESALQVLAERVGVRLEFV